MQEQYKEAKIEFLKSSLRKDEQKKIDDLKRVINLGKKLKKDTSADEKQLQILIKNQTKSTNTLQNSATQTTKKESISTTQKSSTKRDILYSIKSVSSSGNSIIVDFNVDIAQNDIKFFELKPSPLYRDVFDIKGYFKDALETKLTINGDEKITIGQFQPDVLRIVVSGNNNPNTSYTVSNRQLIIQINSNTKNSLEAKNVTTNTNLSTTSSTNSTNIDKINSIRSIESNENQINVKFNKKFSKQNLRYTTTKKDGNFEYIFDINGKYQFAQSTKLQLDDVDKIVTTQANYGVKIRLISKDVLTVTHSLLNNELTIKANKNQPVKQTPTNLPASVTNQIQNIPSKSKNKTIVIDAGHGGDDVGAVGPNNRYEKVVNLAVTKYLEAILKQRGYKVYLTRSTDKFIKVMDRTILANEKNADLFISIHTNSIPKEKANSTSGIETFFLSPARSERAKRVAALENKSDIREMSESSKNSFLESLNRPRITASHKFAIDVQAGLLQAARSKYKNVNDSGVREGPFWVLVGAQMPSILVELGYISHPEESRRLYETDYQQLLANGIANGIDSYFLKNP